MFIRPIAVILRPITRVSSGHQPSIFLLLSADDLITQVVPDVQCGIMEQHPKITLTHGKEIELSRQVLQDLPQQGSNGQWVVQPGIELIKELCNSTINRIKTSTVVVRTDAQKRVGGYRSGLPHAGDLEMWLRLASLGDVAETELIQGIKRMHGTNMSVIQFGTTIAISGS